MIATAMVMVLSVGLPVVAEAAMVPSAVASAVQAGSTAGSVATPNGATVAGSPTVPTSPHKGTLDVYLNAPGGATTVDPSVAYYTVDYEPILNVYETLVSYNGSSTSTFVPTAATCVPGTPQCTTDYGTGSITGFTGLFNASGGVFTGSNGQPIYWTFVIDPAAHFYDPSTKASWPVYPSDVMFSIVRTVGFADLPGFAYQPGWIVGQSLMPIGNPTWDAAMHVPYNNTPYDVLTSMLVNNTSFCPATAMDGVHGDGCITFVADGSGVDWPAFLEFVADNLGASIEPCGWFSAPAQGGAVPGFPGTTAANGDGSCMLPGNVDSTSAAGFQTYLASVANNTPGEYSWDAWENDSLATPAINPNLMGVMLGSGPYYGQVTLSTGYGLEPNPAYLQPSGCGGNPADFPGQYTGYCDPAPGKFIANVSVEWNTGDAVGLADYNAGTADMADIEVAHTAEMLSLQAAGKINILQAPSLSVFQQNYVDYWNSTARAAAGLSGANNIPGDFFSYEAARGLLQMSYPFATIESTVWTVDGLATLQGVGGAIPYGMACYYAPTLINGCTNSYTVNFPYLFNSGVVDTNPSTVGSAAWWYAQGTNPSSPYYDPELAACSPGSPCEFSIESTTGNPSQDAANSIWISSIESITGGALQPNSPDISAADLLVDCGEATAMTNPCSIFNYGWIPDYPDPTDYMAAYGLPNGTYTGPDANGQQLFLPAFDNPTACGHNGPGLANAQYWASVSNATMAVPNDCQGVAYGSYIWLLDTAGSLAASPYRILLYDLSQSIMNALNFYTWTGQQVVYFTAAPWIATSSINTNVMIGTGDDQFWFQLKYVTPVSTVPTKFVESGLGKGTSWTVTVNGQEFSSTKTSISIPEPVGTYTYSLASGSLAYKPTPKTGTFTVTSKPGTVSVKFVGVESLVTFKESGLVKGTSWTVTIGLVVLTNTTSKQSAIFANGTYTYTATATGYTAITGTFTVTAPTPVSVKLKFTPYNPYGVTFTESGLATGAKWSVALKLEKGTGLLAAKPGSQTTTGASISWTDLANGTYTYTAKAKGYGTLTGTITINGANAAPVTLTFTKI